jgi:hypothetical protein
MQNSISNECTKGKAKEEFHNIVEDAVATEALGEDEDDCREEAHEGDSESSEDAEAPNLGVGEGRGWGVVVVGILWGDIME